MFITLELMSKDDTIPLQHHQPHHEDKIIRITLGLMSKDDTIPLQHHEPTPPFEDGLQHHQPTPPFKDGIQHHHHYSSL